MCKFDQYLHTSRKSGINVYAICVGWVNFVHNLRCLLKNLRSQQKFYATAGPTGPDKYELCYQQTRLIRSPDEVSRHLSHRPQGLSTLYTHADLTLAFSFSLPLPSFSSASYLSFPPKPIPSSSFPPSSLSSLP